MHISHHQSEPDLWVALMIEANTFKLRKGDLWGPSIMNTSTWVGHLSLQNHQHVYQKWKGVTKLHCFTRSKIHTSNQPDPPSPYEAERRHNVKMSVGTSNFLWVMHKNAMRLSWMNAKPTPSGEINRFLPSGWMASTAWNQLVWGWRWINLGGIRTIPLLMKGVKSALFVDTIIELA